MRISCYRQLFCVLAVFGSQATFAEVYPLGSTPTEVVGELGSVSSTYEDTFTDIGRLHNVGYEELKAANPAIDPWLPGEGTSITLPTRFVLPRGIREGIIVNLAEYRVYYFYSAGEQRYVSTVPASIGKMDWATPIGKTRIVAKAQRPSWYPPQSVREEHAADGRTLPNVVPPGPDNPLGDYALRLGLPGYLIHGTNRPAGVGMQVTHGCIRLFPEDIEWLFPRVAVETPVQFVNQPVKFGWQGDTLFLEVHAVPAGTAVTEPGMTLVTEEFVAATSESEAQADWGLIARVFQDKTGIPVAVGVRVPTAETALSVNATD